MLLEEFKRQFKGVKNLILLIVSLSLYRRVVEKPIITAKLFSIILYKVVYEDPPT